MQDGARGRYRVRYAGSYADVEAAQRLRHQAFIAARGLAATVGGIDQDAHDDRCKHVLVEEAGTGVLVCCFRLFLLHDSSAVGQSYSARYYGLAPLAVFPAPMIEIGRFCLIPDRTDPDILRLAWAFIAQEVDRFGAKLLFGCSSFNGTALEGHADALALLGREHVAPRRWRPRVKATLTFPFAARLRGRVPDRRRAMLAMPPLLRSYIAMGGWVSDHAVIDQELDTIHVFTGLEIGAIPPARVRLLRGLAV